MFVNLSIAPLFPYQYADGRRISCDAFSSLDNTMHVLSFLTACFWEEEIYPYPDPDHLVVLGSAEGVARCRVTAGAICGTSFLVGDDLTNIKEGSAAEKRILKMFANPGIISVAKLGRAFTPYDVLPGERCADAYYCEDNGYLYIAVFNFGERKSEKSFDLSKITSRVSSGAEYTELWSDAVGTLESPILNVSVKGQDVVLFKITEDPESEPEVPANGAKISKTHTVPIIVASSLAALGVVGAGAAFAILRKKKKNKG